VGWNIHTRPVVCVDLEGPLVTGIRTDFLADGDSIIAHHGPPDGYNRLSSSLGAAIRDEWLHMPPDSGTVGVDT
jgi:hypothetical protein